MHTGLRQDKQLLAARTPRSRGMNVNYGNWEATEQFPMRTHAIEEQQYLIFGGMHPRGGGDRRPHICYTPCFAGGYTPCFAGGDKRTARRIITVQSTRLEI